MDELDLNKAFYLFVEDLVDRIEKRQIRVLEKSGAKWSYIISKS